MVRVRVIKCVVIIAKNKKIKDFWKATGLTNKMWNTLYILVLIMARKTDITESGSSSLLRTPFNTVCPLKTRKVHLSAYKLSASSTDQMHCYRMIPFLFQGV
jgi:hypothetical protein